MNIIVVTAAGVALFFIFRLLVLLPERLSLSRSRRTQIDRLLPAIEFFTWLIFVFWALFYTLETKTYFPYLIYSLVIVLVLLFSWFILKDVLAGMVFRFQNNHTTGQKISLKGINGRIRNFGITHIQIDSNGSIFKIPYSRLSGEIISESPEIESNRSTIRIAVSKPASIDDAIARIRFLLLNYPWIFPESEPSILCSAENENEYIFDITTNLIDENQGRRVEEYLKENLILGIRN
jgi:hypothetical protein